MAEKGENCTLTIQILDKSFQVSCPVEERAALAESARYLDEKMRGIRSSGSIIGMERIAVMAALNIANDLLKLRTRGQGAQAEVGQRLKIMRERVESALEKGQQLEL